MADLYIRSSDGCTLTKAKTLNIESYESCYVIYGDLDYSLPLGAYKTEERAKEILDEIQKLMEQPIAFLKSEFCKNSPVEISKAFLESLENINVKYVGTKDCEIIPTNNTNIVFTMPEK